MAHLRGFYRVIWAVCHPHTLATMAHLRGFYRVIWAECHPHTLATMAHLRGFYSLDSLPVGQLIASQHLYTALRNVIVSFGILIIDV